NSFSAAHLSSALAGRTGPIKNALLNQQIVAGIGNIYACEALFYAGISPRRKAGTIAGRRADRLVTSIRDVLGRAIAEGGTSLRDHVQPGGEIGYFVQQLAVYGRDGEACTSCAAPIQTIVQSGRSSFFCAKCQR
ncbi:MAG: DNA-formamidopyrimidine glycosylase, partial [Alphaproteobacteria bacterium]|nr:DNA-formamidopyrimidine glycosylase [Alphaproteobacteria bacterium]